jgi:hypothetical protein
VAWATAAGEFVERTRALLGIFRRIVLDLGPTVRVFFAGVYLAIQATLVWTASARADRAFGFQMFNESSTMIILLSREVEAPSGHGTIAVLAPHGEWVAKDAMGFPHRFAWHDRVRAPELCAFDRPIPAPYGTAAQLARLQAALDDVATHTPDDADTARLMADVTLRRNGREATLIRLTSLPRLH